MARFASDLARFANDSPRSPGESEDMTTSNVIRFAAGFHAFYLA
jgi:hypothetical protein